MSDKQLIHSGLLRNSAVLLWFSVVVVVVVVNIVAVTVILIAVVVLVRVTLVSPVSFYKWLSHWLNHWCLHLQASFPLTHLHVEVRLVCFHLAVSLQTVAAHVWPWFSRQTPWVSVWPRSPNTSLQPSPSEIQPSTVSRSPTGRGTLRSATGRMPTAYRRTHQRSGYSKCQHAHDMVGTHNLEPESDAGKQQQSPHFHSKEAQFHLRDRRRVRPQTERREEGSLQGSRDHCARWEHSLPFQR